MNPDEEVIYNGQPMTRECADALQEAQQLTHYVCDTHMYARLPYGTETFRIPAEAGKKPCRHCGVVKGQLHEPMCDYEQCPICHGQVMSCDCGIFVENAVQP